MAYAALVSLEQSIHQILNQDRYSTSPQQKHYIISLDKCVISFQAFLEDFPKEAQNLEARIRDAATAAEDIIECFMLDQIRKSYGCIMWMNEIAGIMFKYKLYKVAEKMEAMAAEVVEIKDSVKIKDVKLNDSSVVSSSSAVAPAGKIDVVGFDDDLLEIKDLLTGNTLKLQYLAISGMGGIGKTTLARNAYDDQLIQDHFDIRAWVTISQDYRAQEILSCLLDSMKELNPKGSKGMSIAEMADRIYKILYGRRYLIVMDDIWSTKVLDDVRKLFPDDGNGSRVMLTTRLSDVAAYANPSFYVMRLMDEKKSWDLLKQMISRVNLSDELEMIGQEIARSCRGLPLAVVVIAGILSSVSETPASWAEVSKNMKAATSKDDRMEEVVSLGYNHLPHRLRPCLLFMGLLPEDYSIRVSLLIRLWIAEGFLKHPDDSWKSLEADAEEYLDDLFRRNLILVTGRKYNGRIKSCGLHDMVRDTCIRLLEEQKHLRHIVAPEDNQGSTSKRSLICFGYYGLKGSIERFRLLRVLHVPKFTYKPRKMLKLYHLRYICFYCYGQSLPADISQFQNLQSLIIESGSSYIGLPSSIWKLQQLRHLIFRGCLPLPYVGDSSALENLQTLKEVLINAHETNLAYLLQRAPNVIQLGLTNLYSYDLNMSLLCLRQLEELKIDIWRHLPKHFSDVFPHSLKKLTLEHCTASVSLLEAIGSLPNLEMLKLIKCIFDEDAWEVRGGEFPHLKLLQLYELEVITSLTVEDAGSGSGSSSGFPMLSCLHIYRCYHLEELSDEIGYISTLEYIQVSRSGRGVCDWARRVEEEQQGYGNETLQVRCFDPAPGMLPRRWV